MSYTCSSVRQIDCLDKEDAVKADHLKSPGHHRQVARKAGSAICYDYSDSDVESAIGLGDDISSDLYDAQDFLDFDNAPSQSNQDSLIEWCHDLAHEGPLARSLLCFAKDAGWTIQSIVLEDYDVYVDVSARILFLNKPEKFALSHMDNHERWDFFIAFIKGLREIWQEEHKAYDFADFKPEDTLSLERVRTADIDTIAVMAAWELRSAGYVNLWRYVLGSAEGDMAVMFSQTIEKSPTAQFSGKACAKAFWQWFCDEDRVNAADHQVLEELDMFLEENTSLSLAERKAPRRSLYEGLSRLPDGMQYLPGCADNLMRDPHFAGLCSAVNQAHLFQIVYDMKVIMRGNVPFRDAKLARMIFPDSPVKNLSIEHSS